MHAKNKLSLVGFTQEIETLMLSNGSLEYVINLKEMSGKKKHNSTVHEVFSTSDTTEVLNEQLLISQGATRIGQKNILEMPCTVWELIEDEGITTTCLTAEGIPLEIMVLGNSSEY